MPVSVPRSPKVKTTKYQNWRGVDYTNDPSNVWYRRSPCGLNMLPELDGQPYKRNGWKVEFTAQDFITASGIVGVDTVEQYKVDYFEIGGAEFLWFYTSIGCFYYSDTLTFVDTSYEIGDDAPYDFSKSMPYEVGDYCMDSGTMYKCKSAITTSSSTLPSSDTTHWTATEIIDGQTVAVDGSKHFPPTHKEADPDNPGQEIDVTDDIDYTKSFFFEGGGRAGYYLFVSQKMFMFDGKKLHECKPTIPTVLTMADKNGVGTLLYDVNMLTQWRAIEYEVDGSDEYKVPDGFINDSVAGQGVGGILNAYTINADGSFTPKRDWTIVNQGALKFTSAPSETRANQTSLRIVYKSANASVSQKEQTCTTKNLKVTKTVTTTTKQTRTVKTTSTPIIKNGKLVGHKLNRVYSAWKDGTATSKTTYANTEKPSWTLTNPKKPISITKNIKNGTWSNTNDSSVAVTVNSYGTSATMAGVSNGKTVYDKCTNISASTTTTTKYTNVSDLSRTKVVTKKSVKTIPTRIKYPQWIYTASQLKANEGRNAFFGTSRVLVFGNGIINQAFLTASSAEKYSTRVWYSMATDPLYFPDTNYIEVGATDKQIMGLMKVGDYLGIIKQGGATDTSIYLAYATSFEDITTYAVKQSVNGIGAISNGAFNILNDEPLFLSAEGIMAIEPAEDDARKLRNRSYYINKPLLDEPSIESAVSFVFKGMYWLCVNNHCYVLDGAQKSSWENTKTNLQYEAYYLDNIPAKCFAKKDGRLWFIDNLGNVCRFRDDNDDLRYVDAYDDEALNDPERNIYKASSAPTLVDGRLVLSVADTYLVETETKATTPYEYSQLAEFYTNGVTTNLTEFTDRQILEVNAVRTELHGVGGGIIRDASFTTSEVDDEIICSVPPGDSAFSPQDPYTLDFQIRYSYSYTLQNPKAVKVNDVFQYVDSFYTVTDVLLDSDGEITGFAVLDGVPIKAVWGTIADDDGSAHYYKKLQKKGSLVALMPMSDSGVKVYLVPDEIPDPEDYIFVGETDAKEHILPFNYYMRKKVKKYKRLQIIVMNDSYNDGFGVDEIIKCYTLGNYAKK